MGRHRGRPSKLASAFTLIELLVVITIIAVLVSIAYPVYNGVQERARAAQDMSNLRQIGLATQMYMNDNDGVLFDATIAWMGQLHPKYVPTWKVFQSPFDKRTPLEDDTNSPVSYGLNGNSVAGTLSDKIVNPSGFILFAPAQGRDTTKVTFSPSANASWSAPGVTVFKGLSIPGGNYANPQAHGTHSGRARINAVFADLHTESVPWSTFVSDVADTGTKCANGTPPTASYRWHPDPCQ
jgi:prepilin-type N-terminal cleavage/methylation domain-containing protein